MREKIIGLPEMYKQYKSDYTELPYKLTQKEFYDIVRESAIEMGELLLKGKEVKLPFGLGKIYITRNRRVGTKYNSSIDWKKSKIVGKRISFHNLHSNDYIMRLKWDKYKSSVKNRSYYILKAMRTFKPKMAEYIRTHTSTIYTISGN